MVQLQIIDYDRFKTLSDDNRINILPLVPTRGLIFDRNGVVLAQNTPAFTLEVVPEAVDDMNRLIADLRDLVEIPDADVMRFKARINNSRSFESVPLRFRLNQDEVARFSVNRHLFPGVDVAARLSRNYPLGPVGVHAIGYVGRINEQELERVDATNYRGTTHIGKTGIELVYEDQLHGRVGYQHVETNARGRTLRVLKRIDPVPGEDLTLNLDISLQTVVERALDGESGAVVAMEPSTGAVLAMASLPGFDPNLFVDGIKPADYRALLRSSARPLFNRALHGQYPPGSTIKPLLGLAAAQEKSFGVKKKIWCPGWFSLPGLKHRYRDWKKVGHGRVNLKAAVAQSCDVYFYQLALALGIDRMHEVLDQFGLGRKTGIDLPGEAAGLNPSRAWKRRARAQAWFPGETLISGIGQGFHLATPLQLASVTATVASRGLRVRPRVLLRRAPAAGETEQPATITHLIPVKPDHWSVVVDSMVEVVHGARGTARKVGRDANYTIAGKTGTAQVFGIGQEEEYKEEEVEKKLRDHALFVAFSPVDQPRLAVSVLVENGGSGSRAAAPVARKVFDYYLRHDSGKDGDKPLLVTFSQQPAGGRAGWRAATSLQSTSGRAGGGG